MIGTKGEIALALFERRQRNSYIMKIYRIICSVRMYDIHRNENKFNQLKYMYIYLIIRYVNKDVSGRQVKKVSKTGREKRNN